MSNDAYKNEHAETENSRKIEAFLDTYEELGEALLDYCSGLEQAGQAMDEHYAGFYPSINDYIVELVYLRTDIPSQFKPYINHETLWRDMLLNGDIYTFELEFGEIHVFCKNQDKWS